MKILITGDVVGRTGRRAFDRYTRELKQSRGIDLVIVNGENSAGCKGISRKSLDELYRGGADIVTSGNHIWDNREVYGFIDDEPYLVRPANYPEGAPGKGWCIYPFRSANVAVINLSGRAFMPEMDSTQITMTLTMPKDTPLIDTAEVTDEIVEKLMEREDVDCTTNACDVG